LAAVFLGSFAAFIVVIWKSCRHFFLVCAQASSDFFNLGILLIYFDMFFLTRAALHIVDVSQL